MHTMVHKIEDLNDITTHINTLQTKESLKYSTHDILQLLNNYPEISKHASLPTKQLVSRNIDALISMLTPLYQTQQIAMDEAKAIVIKILNSHSQYLSTRGLIDTLHNLNKMQMSCKELRGCRTTLLKRINNNNQYKYHTFLPILQTLYSSEWFYKDIGHALDLFLDSPNKESSQIDWEQMSNILDTLRNMCWKPEHISRLYDKTLASLQSNIINHDTPMQLTKAIYTLSYYASHNNKNTTVDKTIHKLLQHTETLPAYLDLSISMPLYRANCWLAYVKNWKAITLLRSPSFVERNTIIPPYQTPSDSAITSLKLKKHSGMSAAYIPTIAFDAHDQTAIVSYTTDTQTTPQTLTRIAHDITFLASCNFKPIIEISPPQKDIIDYLEKENIPYMTTEEQPTAKRAKFS